MWGTFVAARWDIAFGQDRMLNSFLCFEFHSGRQAGHVG